MFAQSLLLVMASALMQIIAASEVAVYWGQNSAGGQERLATYCESSSIDIVLVSFINGFPDLEVNFSNQCGLTFDSGLLHCSQIGEDIKYCQSLGKKVLLSMGGASGSYGFSSEAEGTEFATTLWNKFGGGSDSERPFDDAVVDGFDFDIEHGAETGYVALANALRSYFADAPKTYYLSAAPQCPYPDATLNDLLTSAYLDYSFIQFYNNYCNLGENFNWATWAEYAASVSPNKEIQLFLGLPGSSTTAEGYTPVSTVEGYLSDIHCGPNFGGFSIWDASSAWSNIDSNGNNYAVQLKNLLNKAETCASSSSSAASLSTSTTSTAISSSSSISEVLIIPDMVSSAFYGNESTSITSSESALSGGATTTFTTTHSTDLVTVTCTKNVCHYSKPTDANTIYQTSYGTDIVTVTCKKDVCYYAKPTATVGKGTTFVTSYGTEVVTITCANQVCKSKPAEVSPTGTTYTTSFDTEVVTVPCTKDTCKSKTVEVTPTGTTFTTSYGTEVVTVPCAKSMCKNSQPTLVTLEETTYTTTYDTEVVTTVCTNDICQKSVSVVSTTAPYSSIEATTTTALVSTTSMGPTSGSSSYSAIYTLAIGNYSNNTIPIYEGKAAASTKMTSLLVVVLTLAITLI